MFLLYTENRKNARWNKEKEQIGDNIISPAWRRGRGLIEFIAYIVYMAV